MITVKPCRELQLADFLDENGLTLRCSQNGKKVWTAEIPRVQVYDNCYALALDWSWVPASEWSASDHQKAIKQLADKLSGRKLRWWTSGGWPFRQYEYFDFSNTALLWGAA